MKNLFRTILLMGLFFNTSQGCSSQETPGQQDRKPAVAGRFYPSDPRELKSVLAGFFEKAKPGPTSGLAAIICPHAGYIFSGEVAANSYNQIDPKKKYDNVFIIASSHQVAFNGASVYNKGDYITPLGRVKVNRQIADQLIKNSAVFSFRPDADRTEHSLEVQVPFLQYHMRTDFQLVPIVIGAQSETTCRKIAEALKPYFNERNLFVISTDFSHYPAYDDAVKADKATCDAVLTGSAEALLSVLAENDKKKIPGLATSLCGWTSVITLLNLTSETGNYRFTPVRYMNSGDAVYGDKGQVVGYWSIIVSRSVSSGASQPGFTFSRKDQETLLDLARRTLNSYLKDRKMPDLTKERFGPEVSIHAGAFVTLKENGHLRGCIGRFSSEIPLWQLVSQLAVSSATEDTRFSPVTAGELKNIDIEISVLSPMKKISSPEEIILGRHGIYIKKGFNSGTFLPQVASETGWDLEEFLGHCSRDKAGIGWDGWKKADLFIYEAFVFGE